MMGYIFRKVWVKIIHHKAIYFLLIIEMTVAMSMYVYSCNLSFSIQEKEENFQSLEIDRLLKISVKEGESATEELPINTKDYEYIQKLSGEHAFFSIDIPDIIILKGQVIDYHILFLDFEKYGLNSECAYMGAHVQNMIKEDGGQFSMDFISLSGTNIVLNSETSPQSNFKIKNLPDKLENENLGSAISDKNIVLTDAVLLPITEMESLFRVMSPSSGEFRLEIKLANSSDADYTQKSIVQYLFEEHGAYYDYKFYDPLSELQNDTYKIKLDINAVNKIGMLLLVTLFVASISIFRILFGKRERELGICQACGAGIKHIMVEIILEVFVVCLAGTILGCLGGFILTYNSTSSMSGIVQMTGHFKTVGISLAVCTLITSVVAIATIQKFYFKNTIELIRNKS